MNIPDYNLRKPISQSLHCILVVIYYVISIYAHAHNFLYVVLKDYNHIF